MGWRTVLCVKVSGWVASAVCVVWGSGRRRRPWRGLRRQTLWRAECLVHAPHTGYAARPRWARVARVDSSGPMRRRGLERRWEAEEGGRTAAEVAGQGLRGRMRERAEGWVGECVRAGVRAGGAQRAERRHGGHQQHAVCVRADGLRCVPCLPRGGAGVVERVSRGEHEIALRWARGAWFRPQEKGLRTSTERGS